MTDNTNSNEVLRPRREYNQWVANETLEDFALRHTARRARHWSFSRIANTALGTSSFLVLELLGATIALSYGVYHSLWAIGVVCAILFLSGLPISYYATRYSVDIDLLTRGAGFGYIGSTISSLIYASFTFIFFALEAAIMASALQLLLGMPLWLGYIVSALIVIPLVTHGITMISRFQMMTQPLWILLQLAPILYVAQHPSGFIQEWFAFAGTRTEADGSGLEGFNWIVFGSATAVLFSLVAQIGEQVDFLRFLPEHQKQRRKQWWAAVIVAGPGWVVIGAIKLILGTMLAYILILQGFPPEEASDPTRMYISVFNHFTPSPLLAVILAAVFVIVCQIKINVANAYAGSLAWSNFFSRLTHHHPGRVVWLIFNVTIALMLMELGVYRAIETILHHYSAFVLAWFGAIVADLVINKPLGLSPKHIEFKRSKLYDINPVGVFSMVLATAVGIFSSIGFFGETAAALSAFIAFFLPFISAPAIAFATKGKYYLIDNDTIDLVQESEKENHLCTVCENKFDREDMSLCPAYHGKICSLCCALETRCKDKCRPDAHLGAQLNRIFRPILPERMYQLFSGPLGQFALVFATLFVITLCIFYLPYLRVATSDWINQDTFFGALATIFFLLMILIGVMVWLFVLAQKSTRLALVETNLQTEKLTREVSAHKNTHKQLERARKSADSANVAKSNYVTSLSHELRTPLNVILGYAQILQKDVEVTYQHKESLSIVRRNGEHLATMIEGLLEISKIEAGKLSLNNDLVRLDIMLEQLSKMFKQQAELKGLYFKYECSPNVPASIKVDEKRLRQILINLLSNAVKFTDKGGVKFSVMYRGHVARFRIDDTGYGIAPSLQEKIFIPFERGQEATQRGIPGSGLGLAICRQLANMMGADIELESEVEQGSTFTLLLQASPAETSLVEPHKAQPISGYLGRVRTLLVVDDNADHRKLIVDLLSPLGFKILEASSLDSSLEMADASIDMVLLDLRLGDESGWQVAKALREKFNRLAILIVSANARGFYEDLPKQRLHDDYLEKPLQLDALIEKIGQLIDIEWVYEDSPERQKSIHLISDNQAALEQSSTKNTAPETQREDSRPDRGPKDKTRQPDDSLHPSNASTPYPGLIEFAKIGNLNALLTALDIAEKDGDIPPTLAQRLRVLAGSYDFASIVTVLNGTHPDSRSQPNHTTNTPP